MLHRIRILSLLIAIVVSITLGSTSVYAAQGLPPLPSEAIRNAVIQKSNGPVHSPLGIPAFINTGLAQFNGTPLGGIVFDAIQPVHYFDLSNTIRQSLIPRAGSSTMTLAPNTVTPDDSQPAEIVGASYDITTGVSILVASWTNNHPGQNIDKLRFYHVNNGTLSYTTPYSVQTSRFNGVNGQASPGDIGALIATQQTCLAIGLDQVCFQSKPTLRDSSIANLVDQARNALSNAYQYQANFNHAEAVPDIIGGDKRAQCAAALSNLSTPSSIPACQPDVLYVASDHPVSGQPVGMMNVLVSNGIATYDVNGNYVGQLPVGYYLVLDATPSNVNPTPGTDSVLFLVSADTHTQFLIPTQAIEEVGAGSNKQIAAIKDASMCGWAW